MMDFLPGKSKSRREKKKTRKWLCPLRIFFSVMSPPPCAAVVRKLEDLKLDHMTWHSPLFPLHDYSVPLPNLTKISQGKIYKLFSSIHLRTSEMLKDNSLNQINSLVYLKIVSATERFSKSTLCQKITFFVKKLKISRSLDHTILFKFN